jgi:hypothetical protein
MAHKLNIRANGVASFASRKEKAWHGLGNIVDAMNSADAIKLGGLDFHVQKMDKSYLIIIDYMNRKVNLIQYVQILIKH